jgi:hypothetical protein
MSSERRAGSLSSVVVHLLGDDRSTTEVVKEVRAGEPRPTPLAPRIGGCRTMRATSSIRRMGYAPRGVWGLTSMANWRKFLP